MSRWKRCPGLLVVGVWAGGAMASAQVIPDVARVASATDAVPQAKAVDVEDLLTTMLERVGASVSLSLAVSDVADFKADAAGAFIRNPDDTLWKTTLTLKGSSLVRSVGELHKAYSSAAEYQQLSNAGSLRVPTIRAGSVTDLVEYFSRTRRADRFGRFVSGLSISGSLLERAELDFGLNGAPAAASDRTKWNFDVTFDPAPMFLTATEKKLTFQAIAAYFKASPASANSLKFSDGCTAVGPLRAAIDMKVRAECLRQFAGLNRSKAIWASLIPTVKLESIDEFDYALVGGQPVLFPETSQEGSLQNVTFTWNLLKVIKPSDAKVEALAALKALDELADVTALLGGPEVKIATTEVVVDDGFIAQKLEGTVSPLEWSRTRDGVWELDDVYLTKEGVLVGRLRCPPGSYRLDVSAKDAAGRLWSDQVTVRVVTRPADPGPAKSGSGGA